MKSILSFICGMLATAAVVYEAQVRAGEMLLGGMLLGAAITTAIVWRMREKVFPVRETHRVHRVVERVPVHVAASASVPVPAIAAKSKWTTGTADHMNETQQDAVSALMNMGMRKKQAVDVVKWVYTGQEFEELMRKCLERTWANK